MRERGRERERGGTKRMRKVLRVGVCGARVIGIGYKKMRIKPPLGRVEQGTQRWFDHVVCRENDE